MHGTTDQGPAPTMSVEQLYDTYQQELLYTLIGFSRQRERSEDARQQAFLKALQHRSLLEGLPHPAAKAWLFRTAQNALLDEIRRERRVLYTKEQGLWDKPQGSFEQEILLKELLQELPSPQLEIVSLRYYSALNSVEIGEQLGLAPSTVRYHLSRAMVALRAKL